MNTLLANTLIATAGIIRGTLASAFNYLNTLIKSGTQGAMQFHQEGIAFAREMGMNAKEAQAYTEVLTDRTERLAMKYGVAAEQVKELQRNISVATSRQLMLNDSQAEGFLQLNKLVGSSTVTKFTEEMMNGMGGQLDSVQGAVSKAYASAAKSGLNAQKVSEKIANNLNLANKLSFRTGIEGLTRMAMQAEKVGMNLSSIDNVASKFLEIDDAIEASARLNMLGGSAAMLGGNPLDMAYEANSDPEALMKRVVKMAQGAAKFDAQKGTATVDPMMQDYLRNVAKAIGMNPEELVGSAKKQASNSFKERNISSSVMAGLTQEQKDFLINKSNVANGKVMFTTTGGKEVDLSSGGTIDKAVLEEIMMKYQGMSDRDIMEENARSLSSINEILTGIKESIKAMFGKFIEGMFPEMQGDLKKFGEVAKAKLLPVAQEFGKSAREIYNWIKDNKNTLKSIADGVTTVMKWMIKYWPLTLAALLGKKVLGMANSIGIGKGLGGKAASGAANGITNIASKLHQGSAHKIFSDVYKFNRDPSGYGMGRWSSFKDAASHAWHHSSKLAKGTALAGVGLSAIQGFGAQGKYNDRVDEINNSNMSQADKTKALEQARIDRNSEVGGAVGAGVGTVLGTFFFGPLGGMIGGAVGQFAGEFIGKYIDPIWDILKKLFSGIIKTLGGILDYTIGLPIKALGAAFGKDWSLTNMIGGVVDLFKGGKKHAEGGVIGGNSYSGDKVPILANSGEAVINKQQFDRAFGGSEKYAQGGIIGTTSRGSEGVITPQQFNAVFGETNNKNFFGGNTWNNSSVLSTITPQNTNIVKPKNSLGEAEYIYKPNKTETSTVNGNTITVKDFNINISGTLKLDAGSYSKSIDGRELLNDYTFMTEIKNMIKQSINQDINGGRFKNDLATVGGFPAQTSIYGIR